MLADIVGHVLALSRGVCAFGEQIQGGGAQDLGVQAVRVAGLPAVAAVVVAAGQMQFDELVDECRIR
ncbi:hypothetical protein D3C86_1329260 [compost metagenome]